MKGWNKIKQWERQKYYKQHVQRMKQISSPNKKKRTKQQTAKIRASGPQLNHLKNGYQIQRQRKVQIENNRLLKRLDEINRRRSQFFKQTQQLSNYYTIHLKSREVSRKIKYDQIQQQNDLLVERIIRMRSGKGLFHDASTDSLQKKSLKKSRAKSKRNVSLILPRLDSQVDNFQQL